MVSAEAARNVVGIIGNVISFALFLSPAPTFWKIVKNKAVEGYSPVPYIATLLNCMLWVFYGVPVVHPDSTLIITINAAGFVLESIYIIIFLIYSPNNLRMKVAKYLVAEFVFVGAVITGVIAGAHTHDKRSLIVGILCVIFGTCMYAAPLSIMRTVIRTKSVKYMPFSLSLASFCNGICWTIYSLLKFDKFVLIPNGLGTLLGLAQLVLYFYYFRSTPTDDDQKSELQLPTTNGIRTGTASNTANSRQN